MKIDIACMKHMKASGWLLSECTVGNPEQRWLNLKHAWQLVYVLCFYKLSQLWTMTGKGQTTYRQYAQWLKLLHLGRAMYKLHSRDSGHDMLSPCMYPSLVHACVLPDWQRIVTNPDAIRGLCAMTITSTMCCLLVLAPWRSKERLAASTLGWQQ